MGCVCLSKGSINIKNEKIIELGEGGYGKTFLQVLQLEKIKMTKKKKNLFLKKLNMKEKKTIII